jgi:hypothetical protein
LSEPCVVEQSASVAQHDHVLEHTEYGEAQADSLLQHDVIDLSEPFVDEKSASVGQHDQVVDHTEFGE